MFILGFEIRTGPQLIRIDIAAIHPTLTAEHLSAIDVAMAAVTTTMT